MKKYTVITILIFLMVICAGFVGCEKTTQLDELRAQGYVVSVTYDSNGGQYLGRPGITIVDMFNPNEHTKDSNGVTQIKLVEPTWAGRPTSSSDSIYLTMSGYFFAGWYTERVFATDENGNVLDSEGNILVEKDGTYYVKDAEEETVGYPACVAYSGYWDFENDRLAVPDQVNGTSMVLYAGWVPYYQFDYYYQVEGQWKLLGTTDFDYKTTNKDGSTTSDKDTIWVPRYLDGAMEHKHAYQNGETYEFPKVSGMTFVSAFTDIDCNNEIYDYFEHQGTLDLQTGTAINRVQNIYVTFKEGNYYKIQTAQELSNHGDKAGNYEILADLDFINDEGKQIDWPGAFSSSVFTGTFEGNGHVIKNVVVNHSNQTNKLAGLFGTIGDGAIIKDVTFENVKLSIVASGRLSDGEFGLLSGYIDDNAQIEGLVLKGDLMLELGHISFATKDTHNTINLVANGNTQGVNLTDQVNIRIAGSKKSTKYYYTIALTFEEIDGKQVVSGVTVDEDGNVIFEIGSSKAYDQEYYDIEYKAEG